MVKLHTFLGGQDFYFNFTFETNFSGHNKIWKGTKKLEGYRFQMPLDGYGPDCTYNTAQAKIFYAHIKSLLFFKTAAKTILN